MALGEGFRMMKAILVEDEPAAMRHLKSIIDYKCSGFEVVDTAENGEEGLAKARANKPDLVITDVKMPIMDGIKLVSILKEELPFVFSVIISGYQDFEYAKGAIQSGVADYLLKPINTGQMKNLLDSLKQKLDRQYYEKRLEIFGSMISGLPVERWQIDKYLPFKYYSAAIVRKNGPPSRFYPEFGYGEQDSTIRALTDSFFACQKGLWLLRGRDDREIIYAYTPEPSEKSSTETTIRGKLGKLVAGYYTAIFHKGCFKLADTKRAISEMLKTLDSSIVIGLSQIIYESSERMLPVEKEDALDITLFNRIGFFVSNAMYKEMKQELTKLFSVWESERRTGFWMQSILRQILQQVNRHCVDKAIAQQDIELLLDEALYNSSSFNELLHKVWVLIEEISQHCEGNNQKLDTPDYFNSIVKYIDQNLCNPITLQSVCAVFGISQTYLSRLFRKYKNLSFNGYLTETRVDKAKRLIRENPGMTLKDIAVLVGYNDQFYFSRVFRSLTGMPPSQFK
jgi:two-component system response regulator YesN